MRIFMFFINAIYWLWVVLVPTLIFGSIGFFLYVGSKENLPYTIFLTVIGITLGVIWAKRIRKKHGLSFFFARIMASQELDKDVTSEEIKT